MTDLTERKPILCLDFDGVCHLYTSGWKGAAVIPDPPVEGMWEFLAEAIVPFDVQIFSSRSSQEGGVAAMRKWFDANARSQHDLYLISRLSFPTEKPPAFVGIDDRVIQFTGTWPDVQALKNFKTWTNRGV